MTEFRADVQINDSSGLLKSQQPTALATAIKQATVTGDAKIVADVGMLVNSGGTFIPRFAVAAHTTGTLTMYKNSSIVTTDVPP